MTKAFLRPGRLANLTIEGIVESLVAHRVKEAGLVKVCTVPEVAI